MRGLPVGQSAITFALLLTLPHTAIDIPHPQWQDPVYRLLLSFAVSHTEKGAPMSKLSALSSFLYAVSRIPGLGFLRGLARAGYDASYMAGSVQQVKQEFGPKEQPQQAQQPQQPAADADQGTQNPPKS